MTKAIWHFKLSEAYSNTFFPKEILKSKKELLKILIESLRFVTLNTPSNSHLSDATVVLKCIGKSRRFFYFSRNKYYSIALPADLHIKEKENNVLIFDVNGEEIDNKMFSALSTFIDSSSFPCFLEDFIFEREEYFSIIDKLRLIIEPILYSELGYVRYDDDLEHAEPTFHPRYHLDTNLAKSATFKKGLKNSLARQDFIDILDNEKERWFLLKNRKK